MFWLLYDMILYFGCENLIKICDILTFLDIQNLIYLHLAVKIVVSD
jgi:hypothetical protein